MSSAYLGVLKDLTDADLRLALQAMREPLTPTSRVIQTESEAENMRVKPASEGKNERPMRTKSKRRT